MLARNLSVLRPKTNFRTLTTGKMAVGYAKDQPEGFTNRIERVAVVGVCWLNTTETQYNITDAD